MATKTDKSISIEVARPATESKDRRRVSGGAIQGVVKDVIKVNLKDWMESLQETVKDVGAAFKPVVGGPETTEVKFGVKVDAKGKVFLAEVGADVTLEVKLVWKRETAPATSK